METVHKFEVSLTT